MPSRPVRLPIGDTVNVLSIKLYAGELTSRSEDDILAGGANALAIGTPDGDWEIVQFL